MIGLSRCSTTAALAPCRDRTSARSLFRIRLTASRLDFHTDRGSPYTSRQFRGVLAELEIRQSSGRTGSCFDNAAAESFFVILKAEIGTTVWETRAAARRDVFRWIAEYYNRERLHSTIGYITPYEARARFHQRLDLAA
ncbi:integrase core domain-containing protein [Streptomyces sp. NPDC008086]|uniref:integrase core domain-containing protein n=1 Tax=Streptomyces sp. NPDC008086 TaxID=3364807 RepID=UPI0036F0DF18